MRILTILLSLLLASPCFGGVAVKPMGSVDTLIFSDGFEASTGWTPTSDPGAWDSFTGSPVSETTIMQEGSVSMECDASLEYMNLDTDDYTEVWIDFWFYFDTLSGTTTINNVYDSGGTNKIYFYIGLSTSTVRINDGNSVHTISAALSTDTWYHVFAHIIYTTSGSEEIYGRVNTSSSWDSWYYSTTSGEILPANASSLRYGLVYSATPDTFYFDTYRMFYGSGMPSEW